MINKALCFGEIVGSATLAWDVATWKHDEYPSFGSCVIVEAEEFPQGLCACVTHIQTGSSEANRTPQPLQKETQELAREYPHIFSFLQTTLTCSPLGYFEHNKFVPQPSPHIPAIHNFIRPASAAELNKIIAEPHAFSLLFCAHQPPLVDTIILAILRSYHTQNLISHTAACQIARDFAQQCNNDNFRVQSFIKSLEHLMLQERHV